MTHPVLNALKGGLVVSCQAPPGDPLFGSDTMAKYALAVQQGGAVGIRANSPEDIAAIKSQVKLPLIGLWKRTYPDSDIYITPVLKDAEEVAHAGADIVAMDATNRIRPGGERLQRIVEQLKHKFDCLLMADVSTVEEGVEAEKLGFDTISTTLSGYTPYSPQSEEPDFQLISDLTARVSIPVFAEGRVRSPEQAVRCFECGAFALVIGGAITRPQMITEHFVKHIQTSNMLT